MALTAARARVRQRPGCTVRTSPALPARTRLAVVAGLLAGRLSRCCGRSGTVIGGRTASALDPQALARLAAQRTVVLVSGTNGKTTTALMTARALRHHAASVASNHEGANMPDGLVAALIRDGSAPIAVLEVDEPYLPQVVAAVRPAAVVLLNITRDQLDRVGETRMVAARIERAFAAAPELTVVANADDPLVVAAALAAARQVWVSGGSGWIGDARVCPQCGAAIAYQADGHWSCRCGLHRPTAAWTICEDVLSAPDGSHTALRLALPGRANRLNAGFAAATADLLGVPLSAVLDQLRAVTDVDGRYRTVHRGDHQVRLLLAKNPAGWQETLSMLDRPGPHRPSVVLAVNAREADGADPSWLWDVPFEQLGGHEVLVVGDRAADLAARLAYAEVDHRVVADLVAAVDAAPPGPLDLLANYTAFREAARRLCGGR